MDIKDKTGVCETIGLIATTDLKLNSILILLSISHPHVPLGGVVKHSTSHSALGSFLSKELISASKIRKARVRVTIS